MQDKLGVLTSTKFVVDSAANVKIKEEKITEFTNIVKQKKLPKFDGMFSTFKEPDKMANYCMAIAGIDYCFWGEPRWKTEYKGKTYTGSLAMMAAVNGAVENGVQFWNAEYLSNMTLADMEEIFGEIPMIQTRLANLNEIGKILIRKYEGKLSNLICSAKESAVELILRLTKDFECFNDVEQYRGRQVKFYKRAQLLCSHLRLAFKGKTLGLFKDIDQLTALADYKIPQILRYFGVIEYSEPLAKKIDNLVNIPAGSMDEVEIRAVTIWAIEQMHQKLKECSVDIDNKIWWMKTEMPKDSKPHHRTRTIWY
ncbi:queuosine salvage family protein [Candidatus Woesearchaeota archaeon]|nr:queuosine salvage family protein [Candidatus Woesearchaeota archaeon]